MRINGPSEQDIHQVGDEFAGMVADVVDKAVKAAARAVTAHTTQDDLGVIRRVVETQADTVLLPYLAGQYEAAGVAIREQLDQLPPRATQGTGGTPPSTPLERSLLERLAGIQGVTAATTDTPAGDLAAQYLATARNRLTGVSDEVWEHTRAELVAGMQAGESIPQLRRRIQEAAGLSKPRAEQIARTEVNGAQNRGSLEQMKAAGYPATKTWLTAGDRRVRETHRNTNNDTVDLDATFTVGVFPMDGPHDPTGPPSETISCRCTLTYEVLEDELEPRGQAVTTQTWTPSFKGQLAGDPSTMFGTKIVDAMPGAGLRDELMVWSEGEPETMLKMRVGARDSKFYFQMFNQLSETVAAGGEPPAWLLQVLGHTGANVNDKFRLYRGVAEGTPLTEDLSITSWTDSRQQAERWASVNGGDGTILERDVARHEIFAVVNHTAMGTAEGGLSEYLVVRPGGPASLEDAKPLQ